MDELWQRYRTFWMPVLIGLGVLLVGVIAVHVLSEDPDRAKGKMNSEERELRDRMKQPDNGKITTLKARAEAFEADVMGPEDSAGKGWGERLNQAGDETEDVVGVAAEQALRAAVLRGAPEDEASFAARLKDRFEDDDVAADKAYKRFRQLLVQHRETLRSGDPNVAWSRLLSDVWTDLRIRANRADVEIGPAAEQLGFGSISSVTRATLPARVSNLALAARILDVAIRHGAESVDSVLVPTNVDPGGPEEFLVLWPIEVSLVADVDAVKQVMDLLTDPAAPVPLEFARLAQPKAGGRETQSGLVQFNVKASSALIQPGVDLKLDAEEDQ